MIDFKVLQLKDIMPENLLRDEKVSNLSEVLSRELNRVSAYAYKLNYTMNLHELPEEVVDHLLWENHMNHPDEGLLLARNLADKIRLLESSIELHRYKGTPYAIEQVLRAVGLKGEVLEWFEYDADPYHFIVELGLDNKVSNFDDVRRLVMQYKNTRSWFDGFVIMIHGEGVVIFDDTYHYPVFYKTCGEFSGEKFFTQLDMPDLQVVDDSYNYIVSYPVSEKEFSQVDADETEVIDDTYTYPKFFLTCGEMEPFEKSVSASEMSAEIEGKFYQYDVMYPTCGEFHAEGDD